MVARGVLIDMARYFGVDHLAPAQAFFQVRYSSGDGSAGPHYRRRDVVLFHTGWTDAKLNADPEQWVSTIPGIDNDAARFLAGFKPLAVGADTWGLGAVPPKPGDKVFMTTLFCSRKTVFTYWRP